MKCNLDRLCWTGVHILACQTRHHKWFHELTILVTDFASLERFSTSSSVHDNEKQCLQHQPFPRLSLYSTCIDLALFVSHALGVSIRHRWRHLHKRCSGGEWQWPGWNPIHSIILLCRRSLCERWRMWGDIPRSNVCRTTVSSWRCEERNAYCLYPRSSSDRYSE